MFHKFRVALAIISVILSSSTVASAQEDLQWEIVNRVLLGKEEPSITLTTSRPIKSARLKVERNDGRRVTLSFGTIRAGHSKQVTLKAGKGRWKYEGTLQLHYRDGTAGELPVSFDVVVAEALGMQAPYERMKLEQGSIEIKLSRAADKCTYAVWTEGNKPIQGESTFGGAAAGEWLEVAWSPYTPNDVILRIDLECFDTDGFSNGLELSPWRIEVPHDDVNFASGKWIIQESEYPKLQEAVEQIKTTIRRYSKVLRVQVFISGHTDSVGDSAYNQRLSEKRARSIAASFRKSGIRVPVFYVGYGEDGQAVQTADEQKEPRNRRARYIMAVHPPANVQWKKL